MASLADALEAAPVVIDGGLGTLLEAHGHDLTSSLWSARLLLDHPEVIRAAHAEFFEAGARVAITASYQVSYEALDAEGLDPSAVDLLLARSIQLARAARSDAGLTAAEAWVAASVGPYGASRADGSEYTGAYDIGVDGLRAWHRPRLQALAAAGPDLLAVETLPSLDEVKAVTREIAALGVPAWISLTIAGGELRSGESLAEAFALAAALPEVIAIGVNCCDAREVAGALALARTITDKPFVVYPNSGELWHADTRSWSGEHFPVDRHVAGWLDAGARLVGGCCRVGPDQIRAIASEVARSTA